MVDSQDRDLLPSHSSRRDICHVCPDVSGRRRCHFLSLTERFCDVLLIMHQGICVEQVAMEEILRHSKDVLYPPSARSRWRRIKAKRGCEEMNSHFFTAPFYFAFIWFRVQGSRFKALVAASPPFFRRWYSRIAAFPSRECN